MASTSLAACGLMAADSAAALALFDGKGGCRQCHSIEGHGASVGPDLTTVGLMRSPSSLRLALIDPAAEIHRDYLTVVVTTRSGEVRQGIALNEDDLSIQLRGAGGDLWSFRKDRVHVSRHERSLMPSYATRLDNAEIAILVAFLGSLRGPPAQAAPRLRQIARVSENVAWLNRPGRDRDEQPVKLLDEINVPEAGQVADVGAGTGFFTTRLARRVGPRGKVYAVELQQEMLDRITPAPNIERVLGSESDPRLPKAALDLVLIANAYHEFANPETMLKAIHQSLKPDGRLVVVEYSRNGAGAVSEAHKMSLDEIRSEIEPAGFRIDRILDFLPIQHGLIFRIASR